MPGATEGKGKGGGREALPERVLRVLAVLLVFIALVWLGYQFHRLLVARNPMAAVDLRLRLREVQGFFAGRPIYQELSDAVYPPVTYLFLWPFLGWPGMAAARLLWSLLSAALLAFLVLLFRRSSGASPREKGVLALVPAVVYATGATIGNGQLGLVVVACLGACLVLLHGPRSLRRDLAGAALYLAALVKPTLAVFFFWPLLFRPGGWRRMGLVVVAYAGLTAALAPVQERSPAGLVRSWYEKGLSGVQYGATRGEGAILRTRAGDGEEEGNRLVIKSVNLHSLMCLVGLRRWLFPGTLALLGAVGLWVGICRRADPWILGGIVALAARFGLYHGWYDDVILLIPLLALFRIYKIDREADPRSGGRTLALFGVVLLFLLAPGGLYLFPHPWNNAYVIAQTAVFFVLWVFLLRRSFRERGPLPPIRAGR